LQGTQSIAKWSGMVIANLRRCGSNQSSQSGNQLSGFIKICRGIFGETALHSGCAHQVNSSGVDDFNRRYFGNVSGELFGQNSSFENGFCSARLPEALGT
jgi:hypothetical protein